MRKACFLILALLFTSSDMMSQVTFQANDTEGCSPMGIVLSVVSPAPGSITSYSWQITTPSGSVLSSNTAQYIGIFSQPGSYDVSLTINGNQNQTIADYITVHALPQANFSADDPEGCFPLCVSFSDISVSGEGQIVEWSWDFGDGSSSSSQNASHCYNQVGNYTPIFSIEDEYGCFADIAMPGLIHVSDDFPNAAFALSNQLDCNPPVDIQITNTSSGNGSLLSSWNFGDGAEMTTSSQNPFSHNFQSTGVFDVCLQVSDPLGCTDQVCHEVTIFDVANASFTVSSLSECEGESIVFTNTTSPVPPVIQWDFNGDGVSDASGATVNYTYTNSGTYSPSLNVSYSAGCNDADNGTYSIQISEGIDAGFTADSTASCSFPFTVNFTNTTAGPGQITYQWYVNNAPVSSAEDLVYTFNSYGVFDIKLVATSSIGCSDQVIMNDMIVVQAPSVSFENAQSTCTNQPVEIFGLETTAVDEVLAYLWDFNGDGVTDAEGIVPDFNYTSTGNFAISLTIETSGGCTASYTNIQGISVLTEVNAEFTASTDTTCAGQGVEFCVISEPGNSYSWNFYDGSGWVVMPLGESCIFHDYADTGSYDVTLTVYNGACNVIQTIEDFVYVEPPVALFEYAVSCEDMSAMFANISIGADLITWDFGDGSPLLSNEDNPTHVYSTPGTYTVVLTAYADGSDCPDTQSAQINVSGPSPILNFNQTSGCPPLQTSISTPVYYPHWEILISNGDVMTADWNGDAGVWTLMYNEGGVIHNYQYDTPEGFTWPDLVFSDGGYYDVIVNVTDEFGCMGSVTYEDIVNVSSNPDFASFTVEPVNICTAFTLSFHPDADNLIATQWVFSDGTVTTQSNPVKTFNPPYNYNNGVHATLIALNSQGCMSQVTQEIDYVMPPVVSFQVLADPSCEGEVVQFNNTSVGPAGTTYSWTFGDPTSPDNTSNLEDPSHAYQNNGTYEVCLTADNQAGCQRSLCNANAVHVVSPEVNFTFTSTINNCLYGVLFSNTTPGQTVSTQWDFGDNQSGTGNTPYHTYPIGVYGVELTVTNNYGCTDSLFIPDILNFGNQVGPFTQQVDTAYCAPFDAVLSAFNPNDTYFDYFWDFNDGSGDPSGATVTGHTYLAEGAYCPSVIMTDPNGCAVLVSCTDTIVVQDYSVAYTVPDHICYGDTLAFEIGGATTISWASPSEISPGNSSNQYLLYPEDDRDYIFTSYYSDCQRTDTIHLVVNDLPLVSLLAPSDMCYADSIWQITGGEPNDIPGVYSVNGDLATGFDLSYLPEQIYTIGYTYTDSFQCTNSAYADIYLHALPEVVFPPLPDLCEDADTLVFGTASPSGGYYHSGNAPTESFDPSVGYGIYGFAYTYTDEFGCINTDSSYIHVRPLPVPNFNFNDECLDVGLVINNQSYIAQGSIAEIQWNFADGGSSSDFQPAPVYFPHHGSYAIHLDLISDFGCFTSADTSVAIHAVPEIAFTPLIACQHGNDTFVELSTIAADSLVSWTWFAEGQSFDSPDSLVYSYQDWGYLPLGLRVVSNFGCDDTITNLINVRPAPVPEVFAFDGCLGEESQFHADVIIPVGDVTSQEWSFGDENPNELGPDADNTYAEAGTYYVTYTATSNLGCVAVVEDSVVIHPLPSPDFLIDPQVLCAGLPFSLIDMSTAPLPSEIVQWTWSLDEDVISNAQNDVVNLNSPGTYDLRLEVRTNFGCARDTIAQDAVMVYPRPEAGFANTPSVPFTNPEVSVTNEASDDVTNWYYDFGNGETANFDSGEITYSAFGEYMITQYVWNVFGCMDSVSHRVVVDPDLTIFVPTAFTPDQNGNNEEFKPVISGFDVTFYRLSIYDRWGLLVFSTEDPQQGWDGMYHGAPAKDDSYSWFMEVRTSDDVTIRRRNGFVILLR